MTRKALITIIIIIIIISLEKVILRIPKVVRATLAVICLQFVLLTFAGNNCGDI